MVVVVKIAGIPWFNALEKGVVKGGGDFKINAAMVGPANVDPAQQVKLLEEISSHVSHNLRQRHAELTQWKEQHPEISQACRQAAETLAKVQAQYVQNITDEVYDGEEGLLHSDYMLGEFVDKYGPRLAHLSGVLQMLAQLSSNPPAAPQESAGS